MCVSSVCPNKWNNVTFDKCKDELQDITVNWGHSRLFVSCTLYPTIQSTFPPIFCNFGHSFLTKLYEHYIKKGERDRSLVQQSLGWFVPSSGLGIKHWHCPVRIDSFWKGIFLLYKCTVCVFSSWLLTRLMMITIFVLCSQDKRVLVFALCYGGRIIWKILATLVCSTQLICHRLQSIRSRLYPFWTKTSYFACLLTDVDFSHCLIRS